MSAEGKVDSGAAWQLEIVLTKRARKWLAWVSEDV